MRERRRSYTENIRITVTGKIAATYLLLVVFSLVAIGYALNSLNAMTKVSRELVNKDIRAAALARDLQTKLRSQERLAGQLTIRLNQEALELLISKSKENLSVQKEFLTKLSTAQQQQFTALFDQHNRSSETFLNSLQKNQGTAEIFYASTLRPQQQSLFETFKGFRNSQQEKIDRALDRLSHDSDDAYQVTMALLLIGMALSTPVGISVILRMHRSLRKLTDATQQIAEGNFDLQIKATARDEFGQLTREFLNMGQQLREYEILNLDASPLTHLPGNLVIQRRIEEMLENDESFAHAFVDLDHFKAFNDRYGFQMGSDVISMVADMIKQVLREEGNPDDFVGHIGGDDYIFLTSPEKVETLAKKIIDEFDRRIPEFYSEKDRTEGSFLSEDRFGVERKFEIMTVSISIVCSDITKYTSAASLSHECAKMKEHLKRLPGSNYLIDRRKGTS